MRFLIITITILTFFQVQADPKTMPSHLNQETYARFVTENKCIPRNIELTQATNFAWQHKNTSLQVLKDNLEALPPILADYQIATQNKMGSNWGYQPSVSAYLYQALASQTAPHLLEIGGAYGIDDAALLKNFPDLQITAVEPALEHCTIMRKIMPDPQRLTIIQGEFPKDFQDNNKLHNDTYDIAVVSAVIHFYRDDEAANFLKNLAQKIKPGGQIVMSNVSNRITRMTRLGSFVWGNWLPYPTTLKMFNHLSPEQVAAFAQKAGLEVVTNEYVGSPNNKSKDDFPWWAGGVNYDECMLFTVLKRPTKSNT